MHTFIDRNGKAWTLDLNVASWRRIRSETGINLADLQEKGKDNKDGFEILADTVRFSEVLYCLCVPVASRTAISADEFLSGLNMESIEQATDALLEEIADFSLPATKALLTRLLKSSRKFAAGQKQSVVELLAKPETESLIDQAMASAWNVRSTRLPES